MDGVVLLYGRQRFRAGTDHVHMAGHAFEGFLQDFARRRIVVHHQHIEPGQLLGKHLAVTRGGADPQPDGEEERAAHARFAFEPDAAAHHLHKLARDGQAQAGAAVLARGGHVGLGERLEQFRRLLRRHADAGVAHGELELHLFAGAFEQFDLQPDFALLGELDGVVDEVGEDLAEPERIAAQILGDRRRRHRRETPGPSRAPSAR